MQCFYHQAYDVCGGRRIRQIAHIDVCDAHNIAPVAKSQTVIPLIVSAVAFILAAIGIFKGLLALIFHLQASLLTFREDAVNRVFTPDNEPDRGVIGTGAASVDDVLPVTC